MLGFGMLLIGGGFLVVGAMAATNWIDAQADRDFFSLTFFSLVVAPLLGGAILVVFGLMEFF